MLLKKLHYCIYPEQQRPLLTYAETRIVHLNIFIGCTACCLSFFDTMTRCICFCVLLVAFKIGSFFFE